MTAPSSFHFDVQKLFKERGLRDPPEVEATAEEAGIFILIFQV